MPARNHRAKKQPTDDQVIDMHRQLVTAMEATHQTFTTGYATFKLSSPEYRSICNAYRHLQRAEGEISRIAGNRRIDDKLDRRGVPYFFG